MDAATGLTAADTAGSFEMGWALADTAVSDPARSDAILGFHNKGFDSFDAQLGASRTPQFDILSALAEQPLAIDGNTIPLNAGDGSDDDSEENNGSDDSDDDKHSDGRDDDDDDDGDDDD